MFQAWYQSPWHHPVAFWAVQAVVLLLILLKPRRRLRSLFVGMLCAIAVDAWCSANGGLSPLRDKSLLTFSASFFVVLGDLRFFVLVAWRDKPEVKPMLGALGLAVIVPIASSVAMITHPDNIRVQYLTYELMFAALACVMRWVVVPRMERVDRSWLQKLCTFEIVQYALWASADIVILMGHDVGFALRLVPNFMYYGAFVPFAYFTQPKAA